jgi:hypothetical protein
VGRIFRWEAPEAAQIVKLSLDKQYNGSTNGSTISQHFFNPTWIDPRTIQHSQAWS